MWLIAKLSAAARGARRRGAGDPRGAAAGRRLDVARLGFEHSIVLLRKAALDHVDSQDHTSLVLRANLARIAERADAPA